MVLKIAICDDVLADRQRLISLIKTENPYCECTSYESGEALLWDFENGARFDIIFLDIFMEVISGVDVGKRIRVIDTNVLLIFVSSSDDFYRESYDLYAFNYLIKPLIKDKIIEVLRRAIVSINKDNEQVVRFSFNNSLHVVRCSQILYLMSDKRLVSFYMKNGEILKSYGKIEDFVAQLPVEAFVRCHQSYIVNVKQITSVTTSEFMFGEVKIPVSRKYSALAQEKYCIEMLEDS